MPREKPYYSDVLADLQKKTTKVILGVNDVRRILQIGYPKAEKFLGKDKTISVYQLASRLLD